MVTEQLLFDASGVKRSASLGAVGSSPPHRASTTRRVHSAASTKQQQETNQSVPRLISQFYDELFNGKDRAFAPDQSAAAGEDNDSSTLKETDFRLPDLEMQIGMNVADMMVHDHNKKKYQGLVRFVEREKEVLASLNQLARMSDRELARSSKRPQLSNAVVKQLRVQREAKAELTTLKHVLKRQPGELSDKIAIMKQQLDDESINVREEEEEEELDGCVDWSDMNIMS